jgi:tRNA threonylcarbamoyladenosine biosynthesis protein TsaB
LAVILNIETATQLCSVAIAEDGRLLKVKETLEDRSHAKLLSVYIANILKEEGLKFNDIDAVAVGKGPGSYTGLRIGISTAKGLCYGSGKPLIAEGTLDIICRQFMSLPGKTDLNSTDALLCPMIDARRMEVYYAIFDSRGNRLTDVAAKVIEEGTFTPLLEKNKVIFMGSGMAKCRDIISHGNASFQDNMHPSAGSLAYLSWESFKAARFEDTAYFEPFYLKDFVTTIPKRKLSF